MSWHTWVLPHGPWYCLSFDAISPGSGLFSNICLECFRTWFHQLVVPTKSRCCPLPFCIQWWPLEHCCLSRSQCRAKTVVLSNVFRCPAVWSVHSSFRRPLNTWFLLFSDLHLPLLRSPFACRPRRLDWSAWRAPRWAGAGGWSRSNCCWSSWPTRFASFGHLSVTWLRPRTWLRLLRPLEKYKSRCRSP